MFALKKLADVSVGEEVLIINTSNTAGLAITDDDMAEYYDPRAPFADGYAHLFVGGRYVKEADGRFRHIKRQS